MDKNSMFERPIGYSIEMGTTSYDTTLDERIEAAKKASLVSKLRQKDNISEKLYQRNTHSQNTTVKKLTNHAQEFKKISKCLEPVPKPYFEHTKYATGLMQRRLEALKQKITLPVSNNPLESTKHSTNSLKQTYIKQPKLFNSNHTVTSSYRNEYKTRSSVQKNLNHEQNSQLGLSEHCKNTSKNSETSVQNRLVKAKEELKAKSKSKFLDKNYVTKTEIVFQPTNALNRIHKDSNELIHNYKNKIKRLNQSGLSNKKSIPSIVSTTKNVISNSSNIHEVINKQLVKLQQKPALLNCTLNVNETNSNLNKSENEILDSFSFSIPQTSSVQQRLNIKKKEQFTNDDTMEWEPEPEQIVNTVNNFRKSNIEYEHMDWSPDSIMHCDKINLCLVIDTNILLSNLKSVMLIIDTPIPNYDLPTVMLPWQVLQELDYIKSKENALGYRSREAARWLYDTFHQCHPRVKAQPMVPKSNKNPDDSILECALSIKDRVNCIYLITDDKLLSVKSQVNEITPKNSVWLNNLIIPQKVDVKHRGLFQGTLHT